MSDQHILVVDDEPDFSALIAEALRDGGFRVTTANDASTAMECLRSPTCDVDLVVTDVMMRHLSEGFDLIREIRCQPERRTTPIVILSGFRELYDVFTQVDYEWMDCDVLVEKPVSPDKLVETVRSVLKAHSGWVSDKPAVEKEMAMNGAGTATRHALVVEDDRDYAGYLSQVLEDEEYAVSIAHDGVEAQARVRERAPDIITLDIQMPGKGGIEFFRELKSDPLFKEIPVVVITGITVDDRDMENFVRTFLETEHLPMPDAYLEKPVDPQQLAAVVANAIRPTPSEGLPAL